MPHGAWNPEEVEYFSLLQNLQIDYRVQLTPGFLIGGKAAWV